MSYYGRSGGGGGGGRDDDRRRDDSGRGPPRDRDRDRDVYGGGGRNDDRDRRGGERGGQDANHRDNDNERRYDDRDRDSGRDRYNDSGSGRGGGSSYDDRGHQHNGRNGGGGGHGHSDDRRGGYEDRNRGGGDGGLGHGHGHGGREERGHYGSGRNGDGGGGGRGGDRNGDFDRNRNGGGGYDDRRSDRNGNGGGGDVGHYNQRRDGGGYGRDDDRGRSGGGMNGGRGDQRNDGGRGDQRSGGDMNGGRGQERDGGSRYGGRGDERNGGGMNGGRGQERDGGGMNGGRDQRDGGGRYGGGGGRNGGGDDRGQYSRNGSGGGSGGGGYDRGGRGGDRGGRGGDRGGRGGRGPARTNVDLTATEASANIICASVTNNFRFYHYGIDGSNARGGPIDSRRRKAELFHFGMFDPEQGLLAKNKMSPKEIEDFRRVTFFEGSFCYTTRPLPFVKDIPFSLVGNKIPENGAPQIENGDLMTLTSLQIYHAPEQINENPLKSSADGIVVDLRCSQCTQAFKTKDATIAHCQNTGHTPQMDLDGEGSKPASSEQFIGFCNVVLQRAMGERMARWGREYIDPKNWTEPTDRNGRSMGVRIFRAFACEFGMHKIDEKISLSLSVDLRAKVIRTKSLMDNLCQGRNPESVKFDRRDIMEAQRKYQGEIVICTYDKKCYSVMDLDFDNSPASLPVQGTGMSHAEYFKERKGIDLRYPNTAPIIVVLGRNNRKIFLPAELVCANELDPMVKQKLPMIASFTPPERHQAIEEIRKYLVPGAQKTKGVGGGLLPALGIVVEDKRIKVPVEVLPLPLLMAAGVNIPKEKGNMWAPIISRADYRVDRNRAVEMNVVVVHHDSLRNNVPMIYEKIRDLVNKHNSHYRFSESPYGLISASNDDEHCKAVQGYFRERLPDNMFVLDLVKPPRRQALDAAYSVVKYLLTKNGYLSQFLNFNTHDHANARDQKASRKSITILQGLARQILSKCGARIWWVSLPREIKLPCVFVGVDVFHSPRKYSVIEGKKIAKASVAAVVVQIVRSHEESENTHTEIFSQTFQRERGNEMGLGDSIKTTVSSALRIFNVNPMSCVMWRDGVGDPAIKQVAKEEIPSLREALNRGNPNAAVPLSYLVVQKRISTKFLSVDGSSAIPLGSLVTKLQGPEYYTFYINGTSPPYSTPKPARFVIAEKDEKLELSNKTIADLSWALCHDYSNWTGAIKLPSPVQCAHKLAELAGLMENGGDEIDVERFAGKAHFL